MANQIGDTISKGHYFNVCTDETNQTFETRSFYTDSGDVSFADGKNAENKVGAIKGITSDFNTTDSGYAASMTAVSQLNSSLQDQPTFEYDETGKITGYKTKVGADTVFPFSSDWEEAKIVTLASKLTINLGRKPKELLVCWSAANVTTTQFNLFFYYNEDFSSYKFGQGISNPANCVVSDTGFDITCMYSGRPVFYAYK